MNEETYPTTTEDMSDAAKQALLTRQLMSKARGLKPLTPSEIEDLKSQIKDLEPFMSLKMEEIGSFSEPVFTSSHFCNSNLERGVSKPHPRSGYDFTIKNQ